MRISKCAFDGVVVGGKFQPDDRGIFHRAFVVVPDQQRVRVTLDNIPRAKRSDRANRWYWGCIIKMIASEIGISDHEELHEMMKFEHNFEMKTIKYRRAVPYRDKVRMRWFKKDVRVPKSTANLSTDEFFEYCERVRRWSAQFLSLNIPDPTTAGY